MTITKEIIEKLLKKRYLYYQLVLALSAHDAIDDEIESVLTDKRGSKTTFLKDVSYGILLRKALETYNKSKKDGISKENIVDFCNKKLAELKKLGVSESSIKSIVSDIDAINKKADNTKKIQEAYEVIKSKSKASKTAEESSIVNKAAKTLVHEQIKGMISDKVLNDYLKHLDQGGTMCIEAVFTKLNNGKYKATTERKFIPWLNDMQKEDVQKILEITGKGEQKGVYPLNQAKQLKEFFEGTHHKAVTAARTEAQKIRTDARIQMFREQNVEYVEYVTAGDERVRLEHQLRDGKIYKIEDAPYLGEYNCRCTLVPANSKVNKGAQVEKSHAIVLTEAQYEERMNNANVSKTNAK